MNREPLNTSPGGGHPLTQLTWSVLHEVASQGEIVSYSNLAKAIGLRDDDVAFQVALKKVAANEHEAGRPILPVIAALRTRPAPWFFDYLRETLGIAIDDWDVYTHAERQRVWDAWRSDPESTESFLRKVIGGELVDEWLDIACVRTEPKLRESVCQALLNQRSRLMLEWAEHVHMERLLCAREAERLATQVHDEKVPITSLDQIVAHGQRDEFQEIRNLMKAQTTALLRRVANWIRARGEGD